MDSTLVDSGGTELERSDERNCNNFFGDRAHIRAFSHSTLMHVLIGLLQPSERLTYAATPISQIHTNEKTCVSLQSRCMHTCLLYTSARDATNKRAINIWALFCFIVVVSNHGKPLQHKSLSLSASNNNCRRAIVGDSLVDSGGTELA